MLASLQFGLYSIQPRSIVAMLVLFSNLRLRKAIAFCEPTPTLQTIYEFPDRMLAPGWHLVFALNALPSVVCANLLPDRCK